VSAYVEIETEYKDIECLQQALADVGFPVVEVGKNIHLVGYKGDRRVQTADLVIRRQHIGSASNDIGFKRQPNGSYVAIVSDYDRGRFGRLPLKQRYGVRAVTKEAQRRGYRVREEVGTKGKVKLKLIAR